MDREAFRAARTASGLSQSMFGAAIGCSRETVAKIEGGKIGVSATVAGKVAAMIGTRPAPKAKASRPAQRAPGTIDARRLPRPYDFATAPAHTRGLERLPLDNSHLGAGPQTDTRAAGEGWQRVPGCNRIVSDKIVDPLPFAAPAFAGWRGVVTASGRVFDYETGHQMHQMGSARPSNSGRARLALQKGEKRKA